MTGWRRQVSYAWARLPQARAEWALRRAGALVERHAALTVRAREILRDGALAARNDVAGALARRAIDDGRIQRHE